MSQESENKNYRSEHGKPFTNGPYAYGSHMDVTHMNTDGRDIPVSPLRVGMHISPSKNIVYTVFREIKHQLNDIRLMDIAEEIAGSRWINSQFDEEGIGRGVNKIKEINPELAPRAIYPSREQIMLSEGIISNITIDSQMVDRIERDEKKRRFSM